jgi:hypothetical protein
MTTRPFFFFGSTTYDTDLNTLASGYLLPEDKSGNFNAVAGGWYFQDTDGSTMTLPLVPVLDQRIRHSPSNSTVVSATINPNGNKINGSTANRTLTGENQNMDFELVWRGGSVGWDLIQSGISGETFAVKTGAFTAVNKGVYALDASTFTANLPATPTAGSYVVFAVTGSGITGITIGRNGSNINGAAADVPVNAVNWACIARYINASVGWLLQFIVTQSPSARWDSTLAALRYHDSQRELAALVGWVPWALPFGVGLSDAPVTALNLPISGGAVMWPFKVEGHMLFESLMIRNTDTVAALRTAEWRVYRQKFNNGNSSENSLDEVANANGTFSFTPGGVASNQTSSVGAPPVYLPPGLYWVVLRNTHGVQTFGIATTAISAAIGHTPIQTKTLGSALAATLDAVAATWTKVASFAGGRLNSRVFGQTTTWQ